MTKRYSYPADPDSPQVSIVHGEIFRSKKSLRNIYHDHYEFFKNNLNGLPEGSIVEIGSGGGFIKDIIPSCLTSDVVALPNVDLQFSAQDLPFPDASIAAILMINVFHHLQNVTQFIERALLCLKPGGRILMVEPTSTLFSRFVFKNFHHEAFDETQVSWSLEPGGRLSRANNALAWIVFVRDRRKFEQEFPELRIALAKPFLPLRYLLSGGLSRKSFIPEWTFPAVTALEHLISPINRLAGLFMKIVVEKRS